MEKQLVASTEAQKKATLTDITAKAARLRIVYKDSA
jgi:hypothetical protein